MNLSNLDISTNPKKEEIRSLSRRVREIKTDNLDAREPTRKGCFWLYLGCKSTRFDWKSSRCRRLQKACFAGILAYFLKEMPHFASFKSRPFPKVGPF